MNKKFVSFIVLCIVSFVALRISSLLLLAKTVAPPNATGAQLLKLAVHPPYQIATPHRNAFSQLRLSIVPKARACAGSVDCNFQVLQTQCQVGCGFCGKCPDCVTGPCTIWICVPTGREKYCNPIPNPDQIHCSSCFDAIQSACNPV